jgi:5-methylcytosine-specific restriction enzyme A
MSRALRVCSTPGCPELVTSGRCEACTTAAEQRRGSSTARGYGHQHRTRFRERVLTKNPLCVCTDPGHGHDGQECLIPATVADHHPRSRRELVRLKLDPNDPSHGRGLCKRCHDRHTAAAQPGGWHT